MTTDTQDRSTRVTAQEIRRIRRRRQRIITAVATAVLMGAWLLGGLHGEADIAHLVPNVLPGTISVQKNGDFYTGYAGDSSNSKLIGYAAVGIASGYGGPLEVLVGVDPQGTIIGAQVVENRETPGFFRLLDRNHFLDQYLGATYEQPLQLGRGIDAVTGATLSSEGVAASIRRATRALASHEIGAQPPPDEQPVKFGLPEIMLVTLFAVGFFAHRSRHPKAKKWLRWGTLISGMVGLGFMYNRPFTLANVTSLLAGYWPDWHTNLYWFLLLGGILFVTTAQGKNPYCSWFCPFGAVQEVLGAVNGTKQYRPVKLHSALMWLQRGLAYSAIVVGLALRNPGATSYEVFGTLFDFNGTWPQWVLLILVLLASLIVYRPWCTYLCPLLPVVDYIGEVRRWIRDLWPVKS